MKAQLGCSEPMDKVFRRHFQVVGVQLDSTSHRAFVRTHTFFLIPTGTVIVSGDSVTC